MRSVDDQSGMKPYGAEEMVTYYGEKTELKVWTRLREAFEASALQNRGELHFKV